MPTEQELVARAREGDERAFEQLVADNEKRVYNLCRRLAGNPEDGAELAQEAFLNAWRGLPRFQGESSFATWIYRLASNVCIDFLRKEKRRRSLSMTVSLDGEEGERQAELPDERDTPERHLERAELRRAVARGLDRLSPEHSPGPAGAPGPQLCRDRPGPGAGGGDRQVPHLPGPVGLAQGNDFPGELF